MDKRITLENYLKLLFEKTRKMLNTFRKESGIMDHSKYSYLPFSNQKLKNVLIEHTRRGALICKKKCFKNFLYNTMLQ